MDWGEALLAAAGAGGRPVGDREGDYVVAKDTVQRI
jgi:hypothetical protein